VAAVVTYVNPPEGSLFIQDQTGGTYVWMGRAPSVPFQVGDRIEVTGVTAPGRLRADNPPAKCAPDR
jgi:hypothetical protein